MGLWQNSMASARARVLLIRLGSAPEGIHGMVPFRIVDEWWIRTAGAGMGVGQHPWVVA